MQGSANDVISARPRLVIGLQSFCVTHSLLELVKMLFNYLLYARSFQGLGPEVMNRVLDLFKLYNTSTRNLVLNAGAVSQGFLKRISARHIGVFCFLLSRSAGDAVSRRRHGDGFARADGADPLPAAVAAPHSHGADEGSHRCLLYTSPSPRDEQ